MTDLLDTTTAPEPTAPPTPAKYSRAFYEDLGDRVVSTAAQAALGIATAQSFDLLHVDLLGFAAIVGTAALISVLKAFAVARRPLN